MTDGVQLQPAELVLLEEACRAADRLDRLDAVLRGESDFWVRFAVDVDGREVTVVIDRALSEARQQQAVLKQLVAELRQSRAAAEKTPGVRKAEAAGASPPAGAGKVGAGVADLTARIAAKRAEAGAAGR
jgi:hypothetical protein